jgi:adenine-specific DNA-methyltransferase
VASHYNKEDADGRKYYLKPLRAMGGQGDSRAARPTLYYPLKAPDGTQVFPIRQDGVEGAWRWRKEKVEDEISRIDWVNGSNGWNPYYRIYADTGSGRPAETIWPHSLAGSNRTSKAEIKKLFPDVKQFGTPKPEALLQLIIHIASNPGDLVLDSFLGSGTTAAVAHKMGRRWIGIELGDHCDTHCVPRLQKVCDGTDQGGISKAVEWKGGGGFKYYDLAPSLLKKDDHDNFIISEEYNADMLAAAMAKQEGFTYQPSHEVYWKQGFSTEQDFIFTTTHHVTHAMLDLVAEEMAEGEHLLICCRKYSAGCDKRHPNIQVKKIPAMLMGRCEFGKEDYSLNIVNLTDEAAAPDFVPEGPGEERGRKSENSDQKRGNKNPKQQELF